MEALRQYAADNGLEWYGAESSDQEQAQSKRKQKLEARQTGADAQRVQAHIQEQFEGKSLEEQTALRDQLQERYGDGILPAVYQAVTGRKGSVTVSEAVDRGSFSKRQTRDLETVRKLAEFCGVDVVLEGSEISEDEKGRAVYVGAHGWYVDGVIHLDVNAGKSFVADAVGSLLATTGHELTHFMQQYAPKQYANYKAAVLEAIVKIDGERTLERLIAEEQKNSTREGSLDKIAAEDEVVADASQKRMGDRAFWETVIEAAGQDNRSSIQRAFDWLKEWFGKIRDAIKGFDKYTEAARILDKAEQDVRDALGQLFAEGMAEAVRTHDLVGDMKNTAQEGGKKNMERGATSFDKDKYFDRQIDKWSELRDNQRVKVGDLNQGSALNRVGFPAGEMWFDVGKIRKSLEKHADHLSPSVLKQIPELMKNPVAITEYRGPKSDIDNTVTVYGIVLPKSNIPVAVGVTMVKLRDGATIINKIRTIHARSNATINDANVLYLNENKKRTREWFLSCGISVPLGGNQFGLIRSIDYVEPNVKTSGTDNSGRQNMERSYEQGSDLELMADAAEALSEAGGEEYWAALLESAPELKEDQSQLRGLMKDYRAQAKRLAAVEERLAEAKRQITTTTNRKLNTRGIAGMSQSILKELGAGDANNRGVAKQLTQILTDAYQKGLDAIDRGEDAGKVWDVVYYEGIEKAADYLLENATHSEKYSYSWETSTPGKYMTGEEGRWAAIDAISARVVTDWWENRSRAAIRETAADRITERVEKRMQKQVDAATARATEAEQANEKLQRDLDFWKSAQEKAADQVSFLDERLRDARADLATNKRASAQQQKANAAKIRSMDAQIKAKRQEVQAWKQLASRNEALLRAALKSKNADLAALQIQMDRQASEAQKQQAALVQKLELQAQRERDILAGKLKPVAMQRLLRAERELAAAKMAEHKNEVFARQKDRRAATALRGRISNLFAAPEGRTAQRIYNEIDEHTSMHYMRRLGMSQAELANEAQRSFAAKRRLNAIGASMERSQAGHIARKAGEALNPMNWIQRMDVATTAALWVACKEQSRIDGMKAGTAEYWQHTTELYEQVLRETQPMYDGLHRSANQKQSGGIMAYLFPFRTVPIQNHGQIASAYEALKASKGKGKTAQAEARTHFAKTVWANTQSAAVFSMMTFLAAALKRKTKKYRDEDDEFTPWSVTAGLLMDVGSVWFSNLFPIFGSELWNIGSRVAGKFSGSSGYTYDAFSVGVADMLNDLASAGDKLWADAGKVMRGEDVSLEDLGSHALALLTKGGKLAGIPADTVKTYFEGLIGNVQDIAEGRIPAINNESVERTAAVNAGRYLKAWIAGDLEKVDSVEAEMLRNYTDAGKSREDADKALKDKLTSTAKDAFGDGTLDEADAIDFLTETGYYSVDEAWKKVMEWSNKAEHAEDEAYSYSQYEDFFTGLDAGKDLEEAGKEYLDHGFTAEQLTSAAVSHVRTRYQAGELSEKQAMDLLEQYKGMDEDQAWFKVQEWDAKAEHAEDEDFSYSKYDELLAAIDGNKDPAAAIQALTEHGVEEKQIRQQARSYLVEKYEAGDLNETQLRNMLARYAQIVAKKDVNTLCTGVPDSSPL